MQTISLGNPFINLKGEWKEDEEYEYLDAVTNQGSLFIANKKFICAGTVPGSNEAWLLSVRGEDGELIKKIISEHETLSAKDGAHDFPKGKEGQMLTIKDGKLVFDYTYPLCEVKTWRHPTLKAGFMPAQGGLIENAKERYPDAWEYLQTEEGKLLCVTEDEWQDMTTKVYYTAVSVNETKYNTTSLPESGEEVIQEFSFNGIGGAPFYVQDVNAGTIRLPDLRGMYAEASGFDGLTVGGVHGDMIRNIKGRFFAKCIQRSSSGAFHFDGNIATDSTGYNLQGTIYALDVSRVVPTGNANKPRAWGALVCVFLGAENTR